MVTTRARTLAGEIAHPIPLAAVAVLVLNDHALKHAAWFPRVLSGKLSDAAGVFFFPILLLAVTDVVLRRRVASRAVQAALAAFVTGGVFAAIKLSPRTNAYVSQLWGPVALDPTDLAALPALALSVLFMTRGELSRWTPPLWARAGALLFAAAASVATVPARQVRLYPMWSVADGGDAAFACASVHTSAIKSGKEGVGIALHVVGQTVGVVAVTDARLSLGPASYAPAVSPAPIDVAPGAATDGYLAFAFDGDEAWSQGLREGVVTMRVAACGEQRMLRVGLVDRVERFLYPTPPPSSSQAVDASAPPP
jgi:hypothetical protein